MQSPAKFSVAALVTALAAMASGCGGFDLKSHWRTQDIVVDGDAAEWENAAVFTDVASAHVAVLNDTHDLYVCLIPSDPGIDSRIRARGFTLWFDPAGGKHKTFGVRFPLGMLDSLSVAAARAGRSRDGGREHESGDRDLIDGDDDGRAGVNSDDPDRGDDARRRRSRMRDAFIRSLTHFEVLGEALPVRLAVDADAGIRVRAGVTMRNVLVYELRVPLKRDSEHRYAIGAIAGHEIGIGFETPDLDPEALRRSHAGREGGVGGDGSPDEPPGVAPGGGGRGDGWRRGRMHGGPGGARQVMAEPLHAWGKLTLATAAP